MDYPHNIPNCECPPEDYCEFSVFYVMGTSINQVDSYLDIFDPLFPLGNILLILPYRYKTYYVAIAIHNMDIC